MKTVYIAHPYGNANGSAATLKRKELNVASARYLGMLVLEMGGFPCIPTSNTSFFDEMSTAADWDTMMLGTSLQLSTCDTAFFSPGYKGSTGCLMELQQCKDENIPYFTDIYELERYLKAFS